jgi:hypothetical protein
MGNTANNNWPYPESTDLVKDGATAIENLADAIDTTLGVFVPSSPGLELINTTSFSGVTSQSINDVFSTTYDNYRILVKLDATVSGNIGVDWRLRVAGADNSSGVYGVTTNYGYQSINASGFEVNGGFAATAWGRLVTCSANGGGMTSIDIFSPFLATQTLAYGHSVEFDVNTGAVRFSKGWRHNSATSFTGFSALSSGNMAGTVSVYGYNK